MSLQSQIERIKTAVAAAYQKCSQKGATIPTVQSIANLSSCIESITAKLQSKSVTPTKSSQSIMPDSGYDGLSLVTVGAIPNNYINIADILLHCNRSANGTYTASSNIVLSNVKIGIADDFGAFKPKIFVLFHSSRINNTGTDTSKIPVTASVTITGNNENILYKHSSGVYYNSSTTLRACSGQSASRYFNPVSDGVQGIGSDYYMQSNCNYIWMAWG